MAQSTETVNPALVNPVRRRILDLIRARPGLSLQDITDHVGLTRTAVLFHARRLEESSLISLVRQGNRLLHFPAEINHPVQRGLVDIVRLRNAKTILEELQTHPEASWRQLARRLQVTTHTVRWHVERLESQGLIEIVVRGGRKHLVHIHPELRRWLAPGATPPATP